MRVLKFWYIVSLAFAFHSLYTLVEESYEVIYERSNETKPVQYLLCKDLRDLYPNETQFDLNELRNDLYNYFNRSDDHRFYWRRNYPMLFEELILKPTKSGSYLLLHGMVCYIARNRSESLYINHFFSFEALYFAIEMDTFDCSKMARSTDQIDKLTVLKKGHPYSDCSQSNTRHRCLNDCFKRNFRLARYLYAGNETGFVALNYSARDRPIEESNCFKECKRENCKLVQLITTNRYTKFNSETFKARPKLSAFEYWVQFLGLFCSFANISFNELTSVAIEFVQCKVRKRKVRIALVCLKLAIFFLALASFAFLCNWTVLNHKKNNSKEREGTRRLIQPKTVHLAICLPVRDFVNGSYTEKTMSEIEKATNGVLNNTLRGIYVSYGDRSLRINYKLHRKVLFLDYDRCFPVSVSLNYRLVLPTTKLRIKLEKYSFLYILTERESLNGNSFWYSGRFGIQKRMVKRSNDQCINYAEKYVNCTGRQNCVERCIARKFIEKHNQTTFGFGQVIDRDWFSANEWNSSQLLGNSGINRSVYEDIRVECLKETTDEKPCDESKFEETLETRKQVGHNREIDLQFDVVRSVEEAPSHYKLALDLVSMQSIFFGFTVFSILQMTSSFAQAALKVRKNKLALFIVYLLCSIGASWHTYHILHLVINGELVPTEHYELAKRVQTPMMVFCFSIDEKLIDRNHQLTGNYLEKLTREMSTESTFKHIAYLNESNEWTPFDLRRVKRFFLLDMKCFRIEFNQEYERDQFHFSTNTQVLKLNFTNRRSDFVYFTAKSEETTEFSKILYLKRPIFRKYSITHETSLHKYEDRFSFIRKQFISFQEDEVGDLAGQLLDLQANEHNLRTLNLPLEQQAFAMQVDEDLFEQLYSVWIQKSRNKRTDLNYQQLFVVNHLREVRTATDFNFKLVFLQKVVSLTNEMNLGHLTLALLNVLFIWFDLGVLDLHSLIAYLCLYLPALLFGKTDRFLLVACRWLKKLKSQLHEPIKPRELNSRIHPL